MSGGRPEPGRERGRHAFWGLLAVLYAAFIFVLSDTPGDTLSAFGLPGWLTNLAHAPLYAGLASLVLLAFAGRLGAVPESLWPTLWTAGAVATYALSDEFHQRFVPGRTATLWDLALDLGGMAASLVLLHVLARRGRPKRAMKRARVVGSARVDLLVPIAAFIVAVLLYLPSLDNGWVYWDDNRYVSDNKSIHSLTWKNVRSWWTGPYLANYAPLTLASYAIDYAVWGKDPFGYHLTNVLLHGLGAALFAVLVLSLRAPPLAAAVGAALFIVHPAQVEAVTWIAERKSVLAVVFLLLSFIVYVRGTLRRPASRGALLGALLLFVGAVLSKINVVVFPGALFLYDLGYRQEGTRVYLREKVPFAAAALFFALLNYQFEVEVNVVFWEWLGGSRSLHVATIASLFARYGRILLFPTHLSALYDPPMAQSRLDPWSVAGYLFLGLGAAGMIWAFKRRPRALWWMGLFWLGFLPVAQIVPFWIRMADRYLHVPLIGLSAGVGIGAASLLGRLRTPRRRAVAAAMGMVVLAVLGVLSWERQKMWRSGVRLWGDAIARPPVHWRTNLNYAQSLEKSGAVKKAIPYYERALAGEPDWILTLNAFGNACAEVGDLGRALSLFRRAMAQTYEPKDAQMAAAIGLGKVFFVLGRDEEAIDAYQAAAALDPEELAPQTGLAKVLRRLGRTNDARRRLDRALEIEPESEEAEILQAGLAADEGRFEEARTRLDRVIARQGEHLGDAFYELSRIAAIGGDFGAARTHLSAALASAPPGLQRRQLLSAQKALGRGKIPPLYPSHQALPPITR